MKIEFDIEVGSGNWTPGKAILEMIKEAYNQKHEHSNKTVLDKITAIESEIKSDSDNPVSSSAVAGEIEKFHSHENKDVLDLIGQEGGNLTFDGKEITASSSGSGDFRVTAAQVAAELFAASNVTVVSCKPSEAINNEYYTNYFMDLIANTYIIFAPTEDGKLRIFSTETYELSETIDVLAGQLVIWYCDMGSWPTCYIKQGREIREILINGLESLS